MYGCKQNSRRGSDNRADNEQVNRIAQMLETISTLKKNQNQFLDHSIQQLAISNSTIDAEIETVRNKNHPSNLPKIMAPVVGG